MNKLYTEIDDRFASKFSVCASVELDGREGVSKNQNFCQMQARFLTYWLQPVAHCLIAVISL